MKAATLALSALALELALVTLFAPRAQAQVYNRTPLGEAARYERQSHRQWHDNYRRYSGKMGPVRKVAHGVRNAYDNFDHGVRQFFGDPDMKFYSRHDQRRVGFLGPQSGALNGWQRFRGGNGQSPTSSRSMATQTGQRPPPMRSARTGLIW